MEHIEEGEVVLVRTKAKVSSTIAVSGGSVSVQTITTSPFYLKNGRDYELAMVNLEMYYSFTNIRADNNSLKLSGNSGKTWTALHIPTGCYELKAINSEIIHMRGGNSDITILPNVNTLQCILNVVGAKLKATFDVPNSLARLQQKHLCYWSTCKRATCHYNECKLLSGALQHYSFIIHAWCTSSGCLQFLPKCRSWTEDTRSTKQFNLSPGNCRCYFNFVSVANRPTRKPLDQRGEELTIRFHPREH